MRVSKVVFNELLGLSLPYYGICTVVLFGLYMKKLSTSALVGAVQMCAAPNDIIPSAGRDVPLQNVRSIRCA